MTSAKILKISHAISTV